MATNGTWIGNATDYADFTDVDNWVGGTVASGTGATITLSHTVVTYVPTTNRPTSGTFNFIVSVGTSASVGSWLNGASVGNITLSGTLTDTTLNIDGTTGLTGTGGTVSNAGAITYTGIVNLTNCTWSVAAGSTLTVDLAGTLNLGTTAANNLAVNNNQAGITVVGADFRCNGFTQTLGTLTMNTGGVKTITVGAGGLLWVGGALNGIGAGTFAIAESCNINWNTDDQKPPKLTLGAGVTATLTQAYGVFNTFGGDATATLAVGTKRFIMRVNADNFWTFAGTVTGTTGTVEPIAGSSSRSNAAAINIPGISCVIYIGADGVSMTLAGGLVCGALNIFGPSTNGQYGTLIIPDGVNSTWTALTLGMAASSTRSGRVTLGNGTHTMGSTAKAATNTASANAITYGGACNISGDQTLAGIATNFGTASIKLATGKSIIGASATSIVAAGAHVHGGAVTGVTVAMGVTVAKPIYHFGRTAANTGSEAGVIEMPAPASGSCVRMPA